MEVIKIKPAGELRAYWFVLWIIWYLVIFVLFMLPYVLCMLLDPGAPGGIISIVLIAAWSVVMIPLVIWLPAYYGSLEYTIDNDSLKGKRGVFWKRNVTVPYHKITNIDVKQGPLERSYGIGTIHVQTAGAGGQQGGVAELRLLGIKDLDGMREAISTRVLEISKQRARGAAGAAEHESDPEVLRRILGELEAIRRNLERSS